MDTKLKAVLAITVIVFLIVAYILKKEDKKDHKADHLQGNNTNDSDESSQLLEYAGETEDEFNIRCKAHIESYLNENEYKFYTSNTDTIFLVPFDANESVFEVLITPHYNDNVRVIEFTAKVTSTSVQDDMLVAISELTNRINAVAVSSPIYFDFESREVKICKSLVVSHFDIDARMFDWYFRCVLNAGRLRAYLDRVLVNHESPALVALDFAHA